MADDPQERREIEEYLNQHHLQAFLGDVVNDLVKERPKDPLIRLADALRACSDSSKQIQGVRGRQILNGEALPALEVEISTCQGHFYGAVSVGPEEERYEAKAVLAALGNVGHVLAESLQGKDPTMQAMLDKTLMSESSLPANAVSAASIACCKAGAKQALTSVYDHVAIMSNNSEGVIPAPAFSIINGGRLSSSSLWVQDILVAPIGATARFADSLLVASTLHRTLEEVARQAGQETLQRGPRGGFCNAAGTFEQLMDCLVTALEAAECVGSVQIVIDVHASRLIPPGDGEQATARKSEEEVVTYDLATFNLDKTAVDRTATASDLLDIYLGWLEKYPIMGFVEPFAAADVARAKDLLIRGHQVLQTKAKNYSGEGHKTILAASEPPGETVALLAESGGDALPSRCDDKPLLKIIADENVLTPAQLAFVNEQRGANAVLINTAKISTVSKVIALAGKASEVGWTTFVGASSEDELEGEFLTDLAVGLRAGMLLMGGLRAASTVTACAHMARIASKGVPCIRTAQQ